MPNAGLNFFFKLHKQKHMTANIFYTFKNSLCLGNYLSDSYVHFS